MPLNGYSPEPKTEAKAEAELTRPLTVGYKPALPLILSVGRNPVPLTSLFYDIERMIMHPHVALPFAYYKSGIANCQFEVEASNSKVADFAKKQLERFWERSLDQAQLCYDYGWGGYEVLYGTEGGYLSYHGLLDFYPFDCWVLASKDSHRYRGVAVQNVPHTPGKARLWGPLHWPSKGMWLSHCRRWDRWYGRTQLLGAWRPWRRLADRGGAEEVIDGGFYRFAYRGPIARFPLKSFKKADGSIDWDAARERMREFVENAKAGVSVALPGTRDEKGDYEWQIDWPSQTLNLNGLLEYGSGLQKEISYGVGVPPELLEASETGSGWSGRKVPLLGFFSGQVKNMRSLVWAFKWQVLDPLINWNFGKGHWVTIKGKLVLPEELAGDKPEGGDGAMEAVVGGKPKPKGGGNQPFQGKRGGQGYISPSGKKYYGAMPGQGRTAGTAIELASGDPWERYQGPHGGHGWKHSGTGEVLYQEEKPGVRASQGNEPDAQPAADDSISKAQSLLSRIRAERAQKEQKIAARKQVRSDARSIAGEVLGQVHFDGDEIVHQAHGRLITLEVKPKDKSILIDFTQGDEHDTTGKSLQAGTLDIARKLKAIAVKAGQKGIGIEYEENTEARRAAFYGKVLGTAGFREVGKGKWRLAGTELAGGIELASEDWTAYQGPHGGRGWQNRSSGEIIYGGDKPESRRKKLPAVQAAHAAREASEVATAKLGRYARLSWLGYRKFRRSEEEVEHAALHYARDKIAENVSRLPPKTQAVVIGLWKVTKLGTKAAFLSYTAGQLAAETVAKAAGASPEQAAKLRAVCSALDLVGAKTVPLTLAALGLGSLAIPASFMPAASASYLLGKVAYLSVSKAANALAVWKAARQAVARVGQAATLATGEADVGAVLDWLKAHPSDENLAVLCAALGKSETLAGALDLATQATGKEMATDIELATRERKVEAKFTGRRREEYTRGGKQVSRMTCWDNGHRVACHSHVTEGRTHVERAHEHLSRSDIASDHLDNLADHLADLTGKELRELKERMGHKAGGTKSALQQNIAAIARQLASKAPAPKAEEKPWEKDGKPEVGKVYNAPTEELHVDPERFQYKLNTDKSGVTQELKGVKTWNPDFAGVLAVWKDPEDGKTYVINGHHRKELADRLDVPDMAVRYINAGTAKEARAAGALVNIAEGRGTAIDAAKFMRDTKVGPAELEKHGVSLKGKVSADANMLTRLSDKAFDRLSRGLLDEGKALAVAKHLTDHDRQDLLFRLLEKREDEGKDLSPRVIEEMAREMAATPTATKTEQTLFGNIESEESLFVERNEVKSHVRGELAKEVNDFMAVASKRRAERVGKAGNVLDVDENRRIAEKADQAKNVFDTLVNRKGEVSDAVNAAAAAFAKAKTKKEREDAKRTAVEAVKGAVLRELGADAGGKGESVAGGGPVVEGGPGAADAAAPDAGRTDAEHAGLRRQQEAYLLKEGFEQSDLDAMDEKELAANYRARQTEGRPPAEARATAEPKPIGEAIKDRLERHGGIDLAQLRSEYPDLSADDFEKAVFGAWRADPERIAVDAVSDGRDFTEDEHAILPQTGHGHKYGYLTLRNDPRAKDVYRKEPGKPRIQSPVPAKVEQNPAVAAWVHDHPAIDNPADPAELAAQVKADLAKGRKVPPEVQAAFPEAVQSHQGEQAGQRQKVATDLDAIGQGESGHAGGWFVRRTGPKSWRLETERGHVEGDAAKIGAFVHEQQQNARLEGRAYDEAMERFKTAPPPKLASGGGMFGAEDLAGQEAFAKLPNGARVVVTEGGHAGRVGQIVHEEDDQGRRRAVLKLDGSPGVVPIRHSAVEPLDAKLSWRKPADATPQPKQGGMFGGEKKGGNPVISR